MIRKERSDAWSRATAATLAAIGVGIAVAATSALTFAQDRIKSNVDAGASREINRQFENPNLKVDEFVKKFEMESREVYAKREAIVDALGLKPGMSVADIGAGTGLFTRLFADRVGAKGTVYAADIAPAFLKHIAAEAKNAGQPQIRTILSDQNSTKLPADSVDAAFICDTYHHFEKPATLLKSIRQALRPDGVLTIVDFDRHPRSSDFIQKHVRASKETFFREIEAAGFERIPAENPPKLTENFFARFRKLADAPTKSKRD